MDTKKTKPKYNILQNFCFLLKKAWKLEIGCVLYPLLRTVLGLILSLVQLFITPVILNSIEQHVPLPTLLWTIGLFTALLLIVSGVHGFIDNMATNCMEGRLRLHTDDELIRKACITSYENTLTKEYDDLLTLVARASHNTRMFDLSFQLFGAVAGFVIYLLLLTTRLPLLLLVVSVVTALAGYLLDAKVVKWRNARQDEVRGYLRRTYYVDNTIMNNDMTKDIRVFGLGNWLMELFDSGFGLYMDYIKKRELKILAVNLAGVFFTLLRNAIAYGYLITLVLHGELSAAEFLLLFTAISSFTQWVVKILEQLSQIQEKSNGLCKLRDYLDYPEPFVFEEGPDVPRKDTYTLTLEDVTYRYPDAEKPTIDHLTLTIKPGEKIAIVGLNGAGKTTLVKLLCGFLDPTEGRVLLNGEDIRQYNRRDYYKLFAAVFQDYSSLDTTIAANVAQTEDNIDYERVKDCLNKAGLTEAIAALPNGLETHYGKSIYDDGIYLSGGQQQRLMLARALYKDAPILVLDEPTAALDPLAESDIYQKYNDMSSGRSSVFISHRLASTQFCDRVLFLENGRIAEEGTHTELLKKGGGYAELFEVQARYYREDGDFNSQDEAAFNAAGTDNTNESEVE